MELKFKKMWLKWLKEGTDNKLKITAKLKDESDDYVLKYGEDYQIVNEGSWIHAKDSYKVEIKSENYIIPEESFPEFKVVSAKVINASIKYPTVTYDRGNWRTYIHVYGEDPAEGVDTKHPDNPVSIESEYLLPTIVDQQIRSGRADVSVLPCHEQWCGVTYREDREAGKAELQSKKDKGLYPEKLWK